MIQKIKPEENQQLSSEKFLDYIEEKIPNIGFMIAIGIAVLIFITLSKFEISTFPTNNEFIKIITVSFKLIFDIAFVFSSLITAKFIYEKKYVYAGIFIGITVFGFFYTIWRSVMYALSFNLKEVLSPENVNVESTTNPVTISLIFSFILAACLKVLFAEASAFMLYNMKQKGAKHETAETRNSETVAKGTENDVSQENGETTHKIEELVLPERIEKTGEDKYSINKELPKTLAGFKGNLRSHKSKISKSLNSEKYSEAKASQIYVNYYTQIIDIIVKNDFECNGSNWTYLPNTGVLTKLNGHKLEPEFFEKEPI